MKKWLSLFILFCFCAAIGFAQKNKSTKGSQFIITHSGTVFNNPPFKNCHAATIVEAGKDTLLYAWFGGDHEGAKNVSIWGCYRYLKQNTQWGEVMLLAKGEDNAGNAQPCWNPVLFKAANGVLFLDYKVGPNPREWWAERKTSNDNGQTWLPAKRLPSIFLGPIKNKPVQLNDGTILYPSSIESIDEKSWQIHVESTDGAGNQWQYIPVNNDSFGVIQPSILKHGGDTLQMLCRSKQNVIVQTWSYNNGRTWQPLTSVGLPNPNSGIDAVTLHNGLQLLVYNPLLSGKDWWAGRSVLKVAISTNGLDWKDVATLEDRTTGEYSYPAVIQSSNNIIHIAYTNDRKSIKFVDLKIKN